MHDLAWAPIYDAPHSLKSKGATVWLKVDGEAVLGHWEESGPNSAKWVTEVDQIVRPTHFALTEHR